MFDLQMWNVRERTLVSQECPGQIISWRGGTGEFKCNISRTTSYYLEIRSPSRTKTKFTTLGIYENSSR